MISRDLSGACGVNNSEGKLIVALDVATLDEAQKLARALDGIVDIFKVGSQLFTACGPEAVRCLLREGARRMTICSPI